MAVPDDRGHREPEVYYVIAFSITETNSIGTDSASLPDARIKATTQA